MKKILIIGMTSTVGGVETFLTTLVENINFENLKIDFLTKDPLIGINKEKINNMGCKSYHVGTFRSDGIKVFKNIYDFYKNHEEYDVIHINSGRSTMILYAFPKWFKKNTKVIVHSHNGDDIHRAEHYLFRPLQNAVANVKVACSIPAEHWMFGKKYENSCIYINNAINNNKFIFSVQTRKRIREQYQLQNKFVIGHVGRFDKQKNHSFLIDIFAEYKRKHEDAFLVLIGGGNTKPIKDKIEKLGLSKFVFFTGPISNTNEWYQAMDLFLMPSLWEGLPITGIEAQTSGLPCVFSDTITKEVDITKKNVFVSLKAPLDKWVEAIEMKEDIDRNSMGKLMADSGWDITTEIEKIRRLYFDEKCK